MANNTNDKPTPKYLELLTYPEMNAVVLEKVASTFMSKPALRVLMKEVMNFIRENARFDKNYRFSFIQDGTIAATDDVVLQTVMYSDNGVIQFRGTIARFHKPEDGQVGTFSLDSLRTIRTPCI